LDAVGRGFVATPAVGRGEFRDKDGLRMTKKPGKRELWEGLFAREYVVDLAVEVAA